jgi:hypothetical protein
MTFLMTYRVPIIQKGGSKEQIIELTDHILFACSFKDLMQIPPSDPTDLEEISLWYEGH